MSQVMSEELSEKVLNALRQSGTVNSFSGRSSAKRFEKEFQEFETRMAEGKNSVEQITEPRSIEIPNISAPADFLSTMDFD